MDAITAVLSVYPKAEQCLKTGHSKDSVLSFFQEPDDDRYYIMIVPRCTVCGMPNGADDYATSDNQDRFYAKQKPLPQFECKHGWCRQSTTDTKHGYCSLHPAKEIEVQFHD